MFRCAIAAAALIGDAGAFAADAVPADAPPAESGPRSGEIVVSLPDVADRSVSFTFGDGKVTLELPRGASFPLDFEHESNGLLRAGEVHAVGTSRIALDLKLASGVVERIELDGTRVIVKLRSRFMDTAASIAAGDADYRLGADDKIQISVNGDPKLTQQVVVRPDGRVSLPFLGDVVLGGLTLREATQTVTDLLARDYLVDPKVDLQVLEYKSQWVMVTGEVGKPGRVPLRGGATLKDALADADGVAVGAGDEIVISRESPDRTGRIQIAVDRPAFERAEIDPPLKSGDIVNVMARPHVYVQGEVRAPGKVPLERGMTLMKAISIAGGLTEWGNQKSVQIISEGNATERRIYNLKDIRNLRIPDPPLKGGDVVYVERRFL